MDKRPSFRKFLTSDEDCTSMFKIPPQFVKKYGENLPPNVTLRIDGSGKSWRVGIEKIGKNYFFREGWDKFAEEVDISQQEFLLFSFIGLSHASENQLTLCKKEFSSDEHDEGPVKKIKLSENEDYNSTDEDDGSGVERRWRFTKELKENHAYRLIIPKDFAKGTGVSKKRRIVLRGANGKEWPVRITDENCGKYTMSSGWYDFLKENKVIIGSMASFEFISSSDNLVEVKMSPNKSIKRGRGRPRLFSRLENCEHAIGKMKNDAQNEKEDNSSSDSDGSGEDKRWRFDKKLTEHHTYRLIIPKDFAMGTGIAKRRRIILRRANGKEWPVRITDGNCGEYTMSSGWYDFLKDNKVTVGSTVSFEYVASSDNLVEARVLKMSPNEKDKPNFVKRCRGRPRLFSRLRKGELAADRIENDAQNEKVDNSSDSDGSGKSKKWRFDKKLKDHHAYKMVIPKDFAVGTGIERKAKIKLQDPKGRKWTILLTPSKKYGLRITGGWNKFLVGNKVIIGSTISFESIPSRGDIIQARLLDQGPKRNRPFKPTRGRGRPPITRPNNRRC